MGYHRPDRVVSPVPGQYPTMQVRHRTRATITAAAGLLLDLEKRGRKGEEVLEQILREVLGTQLPSKLTWYVMDGHPVGVLIGRTTDVDLLVVGARGEGGFTGLLTGSVSEQCVRHAACSVVVVRPRE
jgi:nucleotide-binding universal stress UspA family protein